MSTALLRDDQGVCWDFSQTTSYPVTINDKTAFVRMTPYDPDELRVILRKGLSGYRRDGRDVEIVREDQNIYTPLFDAHFERLDGKQSSTPEQQREWFDRYPHLKPGIIEYTFGGLATAKDEDEEEAVDDELFDITADLSGEFQARQSIYDDETGEVVEVFVTHRYQQPTEAQFRRYKASRRDKFLRRKTLWTITEDHKTLETLYDECILSIDGGAVDGQRCTAETKAAWVKKVPLWHKLWIVDRIFSDIIAKNE